MATVSTFRDGKERWTELELEHFGDNNEDPAWELTVIGVTQVSGEWEHVKTKTCRSEAEVVESLRDKSGRLSLPAQELLRKVGIEYAGSGT